MIITRAPLRISFFGGGTDYPEYFRSAGGAVLATAIDKYCYITASRFPSHLFDYAVRVSYREVELAKSPRDIRHRVYRACLEYCALERDIELHNVADLPAFTGLGSSSAFTVSLLQALAAFQGRYINPMELAYQAIHIERTVLKENVGCQDQLMAAMGGFNLVEFRAEDDIVVHRVPAPAARLHELQAHLLLVFTNLRRSADEIAGRQIRKIGANADLLGRMRAMVDRGYDILCGQRPLTAFGELLHEAWMAKRSLESGVSNATVDAMYENGRQAGALGGKLLGAGGGGFLLFFAPPERHAAIRAAFPDQEIIQPVLAAPGSEIVFAT